MIIIIITTTIIIIIIITIIIFYKKSMNFNQTEREKRKTKCKGQISRQYE